MKLNLTAFLVGFTTVALLFGGALGIALGLVWLILNYSPLGVIVWAILIAASVAGLGNVAEERRNQAAIEAQAQLKFKNGELH